MSDSTILIAGAALLLFALVLIALARTGRKPPEPPVTDGTPITPVLPDEPLPEPGLIGGITPSELAPAPPPVAGGPPDPLTRLKGLGPRAEATLNGLGITRYDQIAAWSEADVARIDAEMGAFRGRIARDRWVEQARFLSAGNVAGFEAVFGKLG